MNGRRDEAQTPEGRLAAVVITLMRARPDSDMWKLDYADFESELRPYLQREILNARLEELRNHRTQAIGGTIDREKTLFQELANVEGEITRRRRL